MSSEHDTGMGTTPGMWKAVSELLEGKDVPIAVSETLNALADGLLEIRPTMSVLDEEDIDRMRAWPVLQGVPHDQFESIVRLVEHEHRIGAQHSADSIEEYLVDEQKPGAPA